MAQIKVEGYSHLVRDKHSSAIINTSSVQYAQYMEQASKRQAQKARFETMCDEINNLKDEVHEIKYMLKRILEK